jgi:hypothetical protein
MNPMTKAQIEQLATSMKPAERWRLFNMCPKHFWKDLPKTIDSGDHYCAQCCTLWSPAGAILNVPVNPATA